MGEPQTPHFYDFGIFGRVPEHFISMIYDFLTTNYGRLTFPNTSKPQQSRSPPVLGCFLFLLCICLHLL